MRKAGNSDWLPAYWTFHKIYNYVFEYKMYSNVYNRDINQQLLQHL